MPENNQRNRDKSIKRMNNNENNIEKFWSEKEQHIKNVVVPDIESEIEAISGFLPDISDTKNKMDSVKKLLQYFDESKNSDRKNDINFVFDTFSNLESGIESIKNEMAKEYISYKMNDIEKKINFVKNINVKEINQLRKDYNQLCEDYNQLINDRDNANIPLEQDKLKSYYNNFLSINVYDSITRVKDICIDFSIKKSEYENNKISDYEFLGYLKSIGLVDYINNDNHTSWNNLTYIKYIKKENIDSLRHNLDVYRDVLNYVDSIRNIAYTFSENNNYRFNLYSKARILGDGMKNSLSNQISTGQIIKDSFTDNSKAYFDELLKKAKKKIEVEVEEDFKNIKDYNNSKHSFYFVDSYPDSNNMNSQILGSIRNASYGNKVYNTVKNSYINTKKCCSSALKAAKSIFKTCKR